MELTQEIIKEFLDYNQDTGLFVWKFRDKKWFNGNKYSVIWNKKYPGKVAGTITRGYRNIIILGNKYLAHRLAFLYMTGKMPFNEIDHINGIPEDNRWENLRQVNRQENCKNSALSSRNKTGTSGVYRANGRDGYHAEIRISKKKIYLGYYSLLVDAVAVRKKAERENDFHPNHGRKNINKCNNPAL